MANETEIEKAERVTAELREMIREANGILSDIRAAQKEVSRMIAHEIEGAINTTVSNGLKSFYEATRQAIRDSEQSIFDRFDMIIDNLLGTDRLNRKKGELDLEELIQVAYQKPNAILSDPILSPAISSVVARRKKKA